MLKNTATDWGAVARFFHWTVALLIFVQLPLGNIAEDMQVSPDKFKLFVWHKSIGLTVLLLVLLRIGWRLSNPVPEPAPPTARWETRLATIGHALLYVLMVAVPLSGWWISDTSRIPFRLFGEVPVPDFMAADRETSELAAEVHELLVQLLVAVLIIHVLAALRHHFIVKDATLRRMLPFTKRNTDA